jgi:peptide chain release factor 3
MGPAPSARLDAAGTAIEPADEHFSAFIFKIQANMDPRHRDRVAFARICSGKFERDMTVRNVRTGKEVRLTRAMKLFANDRESIEVAFAGDVVGLANPGTFAIGDTLADSSDVRFDPIPAFEPEHFALVRSIDTASYKSFQKGIAQLREEGAIQVLYPFGQTRIEPILAAVGALQFEVVKYRLESEYNVKTQMTTLPFTLARNVSGDAEAVAAAQLPSNAKLVEDWDGAPLGLFESAWSMRLAAEWNPRLTFEPFGVRGLAAVVSS